jgi:uncharacterized membrane protein YebE (DUF533 family)
VNEHLIKVANTTAGGGAIAGGIGALTLNEWLGIGGFVVAFAAAAISVYFNWKDDRRKELEHKMRLRNMPL